LLIQYGEKSPEAQALSGVAGRNPTWRSLLWNGDGISAINNEGIGFGRVRATTF
jgi:hypothetical protein